MSFAYWAVGFVAATLLVVFALSINGKSEHAGGHGHDDHGHDDHGHGHGHH